MLSNLEQDCLALKLWLNKALLINLLTEEDFIYVRNRVLHRIGLDTYVDVPVSEQFDYETKSLSWLTGAVVAVAQRHGKVPKGGEEAFFDALMDEITPSPWVVNHRFQEIKERYNADFATSYFYNICLDNGYIKADKLAENIQFPYKSKYGKLDITINVAKPEKDPKAIAEAAKTPKTGYPETALSVDNEGYYGDKHHASRSQLRLVNLNLAGTPFGYQFSPYAYFDHHAIFMSKTVEPMHIDRSCFEQLLSAVEQLPVYAIGSNADLPLVGGSILSHHHFQGGRDRFAMTQAPVKQELKLGLRGVKAGLLDWPLTTIRLTSDNKEALVKACNKILAHWRTYEDPSVGLVAQTEGQIHNTITPIARYKDKVFQMDLVLRNNRTTPDHPYGIFHPGEHLHHIKKENIGLIEVMGLAILPGRLKGELLEVARFVLDEPAQVAPYHVDWAESLRKAYRGQKIEGYMQRAVGKVFQEVLEACGIFKDTPEGQAALQAYIDSLKGEM